MGKRYSKADVQKAARSCDASALRSVDAGTYVVTEPGPADFGPYTEYGPAQERAMKEQNAGLCSVRIDREADGWHVRGVRR